MLSKNKKKLNEAFVEHDGVVCLNERSYSRYCHSVYRINYFWDIYDIRTWEGGSQFVCMGSVQNAMEHFFPRGQEDFNANINEETKLLFIVSAGRREVAAAIITGRPDISSVIEVIPYYCEKQTTNCPMIIEYSPNFYNSSKGINQFNLVLPENTQINLNGNCIDKNTGIVVVDNKFNGISFAFRDPEIKKSIEIPEGVTELAKNCLNNGVFLNYYIKIPASVRKINSLTTRWAFLQGATLDFDLTKEEVSKLEGDSKFIDCLLNEDTGINLVFRKKYSSEDDFKADLFSEVEELKDEENLEKLKSQFEAILRNCFDYYKTEDENSLSEDIKTRLNQLKEIISKKENLIQLSNQHKFAFKINGNEAWVVDCFDLTSPNLVIPETYKGKLVTRLEKYSLHRDLCIDTLVLPKGIKFLGKDCIKEVNNIKTLADPKKIRCNPASIRQIEDLEPIERFNSVSRGRIIDTLNLYEFLRTVEKLRVLQPISQDEYNEFLQGDN